MFKTCTVLFVLVVVVNCMPDHLHPPCLGNPCGDPGTCVIISADIYKCICPENYVNYGIKCVYDPCYGNPCGDFGTCYHNGEQRRCECVNGYQGEPCVPIPYYQ